MKKLMFALAVAAMAASSFGAKIDWKWSMQLKEGFDSKAAYSGTVYLFNAGEVTQQQILNSSLAAYAASAIDSYTTGDGKMGTAKTIADPYSDYTGKLRQDGAVNYLDYFYAAIGTDESGNDYVFLSKTFNGQVQTAKDTNLSSSLSGMTKTTTSTTFDGSNWYAAVPEPTSGLLLLLGVAGLALKRKRA